MSIQNEVKSNVYMKRRLLAQAFEVLKERHMGQYLVTKGRWCQLMNVVDHKRSQLQLDLLLCVLDDQGIQAISELPHSMPMYR